MTQMFRPPLSGRTGRIAKAMGIALPKLGCPLSPGEAAWIGARCRQCHSPAECDRLVERGAMRGEAPGFCLNLRTLCDHQPHLGLTPPSQAAAAPASGSPAPEPR